MLNHLICDDRFDKIIIIIFLISSFSFCEYGKGYCKNFTNNLQMAHMKFPLMDIMPNYVTQH